MIYGRYHDVHLMFVVYFIGPNKCLLVGFLSNILFSNQQNKMSFCFTH